MFTKSPTTQISHYDHGHLHKVQRELRICVVGSARSKVV